LGYPSTTFDIASLLIVVHFVVMDLLALTTVQLEPVGRWYESFCSRRHHQQTLSHGSLVSSSSDDEEAELILDEEDDAQLLASLDPKEWKVREHFSHFRLIYYCYLLPSISSCFSEYYNIYHIV